MRTRNKVPLVLTSVISIWRWSDTFQYLAMYQLTVMITIGKVTNNIWILDTWYLVPWYDPHTFGTWYGSRRTYGQKNKFNRAFCPSSLNNEHSEQSTKEKDRNKDYCLPGVQIWYQVQYQVPSGIDHSVGPLPVPVTSLHNNCFSSRKSITHRTGIKAYWTHRKRLSIQVDKREKKSIINWPVFL